MRDVGVGLIGCGAVSGVYLDNAPRLAHGRGDRARRVAAERGLVACDVEVLLAIREAAREGSVIALG
jgi:hypothetical protein